MKKGLINKNWLLNNEINPFIGQNGFINEIIIRLFYKQIGNII